MKLRLAVIGAGHLGRIHARLAKQHPSAELIAVVDPISSAREAVAADVGVPGVADYRALVGKIDAAIVAAPTQLHHAVTTDLLATGIHVLVEKPIASTVSQAAEMIAQADREDLVLQVGHVERFNPAFCAIRELCGAPKYIEAQRSGPYSCRSIDVGVTLDLMIHDIDLVLALVRDELVEVSALGAAVVGPHEDWAQARLTFAGGCVANLGASRVSPTAVRSLSVYSEDGFTLIDMQAKTARTLHGSPAAQRGEIDVLAMSPVEKNALKDRFFSDVVPLLELPVRDHNAILEEQGDFLSAIQEARPPIVTGQDGKRALEVAERVVQALHEHSWDQADTTPTRSDRARVSPLRGPHWRHAPQPPRLRAG